MPEEVYPAIEKCDAVLVLCPNYNDSLGADLVAEELIDAMVLNKGFTLPGYLVGLCNNAEK